MTVQVVCDFDGTIAEQDMISAIMQAFAPEASRPLIAAVKQGELSVRDGVEAMFRLIPATCYDEVVAFARARTVVRPGFSEFIHSCGKLGWKIAVVSGGMDFFVEPVIHRLSTPVDIYCNRLEPSDGHLVVRWGMTCDAACAGGCGMCKPSVMRQLRQPTTKFIVIGDGVTDFKAAREADYVFARDALWRLVRQEQLPAAAFTTFFDILAEVEDRSSALYDYIS